MSVAEVFFASAVLAMTRLLTALYFAGILVLLALMESNARRERAYKKATDGIFNRGIKNSPVVGLNALDAATRCSELTDGAEGKLGTFPTPVISEGSR